MKKNWLFLVLITSYFPLLAQETCKPGFLSVGLHMEIPQFNKASLASSESLNKLFFDLNISPKFRISIEGGYKSSENGNVTKEKFDVGGGLFIEKQHGPFNVYGGPRFNYVKYDESSSYDILIIKNSIDKSSTQMDGGIAVGGEYMPTKWVSVGGEVGLSYFSSKDITTVNIDETLTSLLGTNPSTDQSTGNGNTLGFDTSSLVSELLGGKDTNETGVRIRFGVFLRLYIL